MINPINFLFGVLIIYLIKVMIFLKSKDITTFRLSVRC